MLVDVKNIKFKNGVYLADVSLYDEMAINEVLVLSGYGFSNVSKNTTKGFLLQSKNNSYFLIAIDDFKKQEAKENEVLLYNEASSIKLSKDNKVEIKNDKETLKKIQEELVKFSKMVFDEIKTSLSSLNGKCSTGSIVIDPNFGISLETSKAKVQNQLQELNNKIGDLLE